MQYVANSTSETVNGTFLRNGDPHVQEVVKTAHEELRQLMRQRTEIMKRIGTLKQTIAGLANLFGDAILGDADRAGRAVRHRELRVLFLLR